MNAVQRAGHDSARMRAPLSARIEIRDRRLQILVARNRNRRRRTRLHADDDAVRVFEYFQFFADQRNRFFQRTGNEFGKNFADLDEEQQKAVQQIYPQKISEAEPKNYGGKK